MTARFAPEGWGLRALACLHHTRAVYPCVFVFFRFSLFKALFLLLHLKRNNRHFRVVRVNSRLLWELTAVFVSAVDPTSILPSSIRSERHIASSRPCRFRTVYWFRPGPRCAHGETFLVAVMAILARSMAERVRTSDIKQQRDEAV